MTDIYSLLRLFFAPITLSFMFPSLCPPPTHTHFTYTHTHFAHTHTLYTHAHTHTILSLLLFSRVWLSNCSGPQRERRIDRKRGRRVYKYTSTVYENHQKLRGGVKNGWNVCVLVCCLWVVRLCSYVVDVKRGKIVYAIEAHWDHWSAESAMRNTDGALSCKILSQL